MAAPQAGSLPLPRWEFLRATMEHQVLSDIRRSSGLLRSCSRDRRAIMNMNSYSFECGPPSNCSRTNRDRMTLHVLVEVGRDTMARDDFIRLAFWTTDDCGVGFTQAMRRFDQRIEHRLEIERRPADDLEHVGGKDSVSSRVRCCSASNSRVFSMAITA